jgi:anthranilate synthase component 2
MKILIIDNYDSFTFNLYQYVGEIYLKKEKDIKIDVLRNDEVTLNQIKANNYEKIIISPGPGDASNPEYFGISADVLMQLGKRIPVLGICLGMQGLAYYYGGKIIPAKKPMHGKMSIIKHDEQGIFHTLPQNLEVMRYHSLIVDKMSLPACLTVTAESLDTQEIMGLRHKEFPIEGVQFHPESFATEAGKLLLTNFLMGRTAYGNIK